MDQSTLEMKLSLGKSLALARKAKGQTQAELANAASLSRATIAKIESGDADPKLSTISELAQALDVSPTWLVMSEKDLEIIAEIADSGDVSSILEMLPDDLMTLVSRKIGTGRKKRIKDALETIQSVFDNAKASSGFSVGLMSGLTPLSDTPEEESSESEMRKDIPDENHGAAGAFATPSAAIGAGISSKVGTAIGVAWGKVRSKLESDREESEQRGD